MPNPIHGHDAGAVASLIYLAKNLQNPMVHEYDLALQQEVGHGTVFSLSYLGALGRELPNFLDVNLDPTTEATSTITSLIPPAKGPLPNGTQYQAKTYTKYGNAALFGAAGAAINKSSRSSAISTRVTTRWWPRFRTGHFTTWSSTPTTLGRITGLQSERDNNRERNKRELARPVLQRPHQLRQLHMEIPNRFVAYAIYTFPGVDTSNRLKYLVNDWGSRRASRWQMVYPTRRLRQGDSSNNAEGTGWFGPAGAPPTSRPRTQHL